MRDVSPQHHLEPGQAVVAEGATDEDFVLVVQRGDLDVVVQHDTPGEREAQQLGGQTAIRWKQTNKQSVWKTKQNTKQTSFFDVVRLK